MPGAGADQGKGRGVGAKGRLIIDQEHKPGVGQPGVLPESTLTTQRVLYMGAGSLSQGPSLRSNSSW